MNSKIDFVSDVSCPWCALGLQSLLAALKNLGSTGAELHFQPFELNPDMVSGGEDIAEHIRRKYGASPQQFAQSQEMIRARGADPSDHVVLANIAAQVGLDGQAARELLASDRYAADVRAREQFYRSQGINAVPAIIINDQHLIEGGQPVAVFEKWLRQLGVAGPQAG